MMETKQREMGDRILTVCDYGNSRSPALAFLLRERCDKEAISCGVRTTSHNTLEMLCQWADTIILTCNLSQTINNVVLAKYTDKTVMFDVGPDRYFKGYHPDLTGKFEEYLEKYGVPRSYKGAQ